MSVSPVASLAEHLGQLVIEVQQQLAVAVQGICLESVARLAQEMVQRSAIILIGVGKSGHIAEKIAATLGSIGLRAFAIHPVEAQHGDLGVIQPGDLVLFLSKSGESEELLALIPALRARRTTLWALTCRGQSRLSQAVDGLLEFPELRELDPNDVIPTTSTLLQLLVGDLLAMAVLALKGTTLEEFHANHPAGRIGRRLHLRVQDVMLPRDAIPTALPHEHLVDLLARLSAGRSGCLVLLSEHEECKGIFTDGDLRRALERRGPGALQSPISEWASLSPRCVRSDILAVEALRLMEADRAHPISAMPVIAGQRVVGLLRLHDCLQAGI